MRLKIAFAVLMCGCLCARAQEAGSPEALSAANELAAIVSTDMIDQLSRQITASIWPNLEAGLASKVDPATVADLRSEFERLLAKFSSDAMKDAPAIYAKYFTAQELRELAAFYRTAAGAKALQMMPKVMGEYMTGMLPRIQALNDQVTASVRTIMQKHGYGN